jgi:hypothetical protein
MPSQQDEGALSQSKQAPQNEALFVRLALCKYFQTRWGADHAPEE